MTAPIAVRVTRYQCGCCSRTHSSRRRAVEHMGRCWHNPAARGCKTCKHFEERVPGEIDTGTENDDEYCMAGVDLTGHPACRGCGGSGWAPMSNGAEKPCGPHVTPTHIGDGAEVKPGPIVRCSLWEPKTEEDM